MVDLAAELDELEARAWPALNATECDGWVFRWSHGNVPRANSVWPRKGGRRSVADRVAKAEAFYASKGAPPRFQVSDCAEPPNLASVLATNGYTGGPATLLQIADLAAASAAAGTPSGLVELAPRADDEWLSLWAATRDRSMVDAEIVRAILAAVTLPSTFATMRSDFRDIQRPIAIGRAVRDEGWLGVFDLCVRRDENTKEASRAVLSTLLEWGWRQGARRVCLAVDEFHDPDLIDPHKLGFTTASSYRYWVAPTPEQQEINAAPPAAISLADLP